MITYVTKLVARLSAGITTPYAVVLEGLFHFIVREIGPTCAIAFGLKSIS